jgi:PTS system nitrogen regulatory IIA component
MELKSLTGPGLIFPDLEGRQASAVLLELSMRLSEADVVSSPEWLYEKLREREELGSTGIGGGVAIPHCKCKGVERVVIAIGTSRQGIDFGAPDEKPVRLFFVVLSPEKEPAAHLQSLAAISKWVKADEHVERILEAETPTAILDLLAEESGE